MQKILKKIWHPEIYHGEKRNDNFFEGWFFKLVDANRQNVLAVIPGIFKSKDSSQAHSFIQILDGTNHNSVYSRFDVNDFKSAEDNFEIQVGDNFFSKSSLSLNISSSDLTLSGKLEFINITPWHKSFLSPGIMGWYSFVPFMECNHGIISLDHSIKGKLNYNSKEIDYTGGRGYGEKDWGSAFPSAYVWMQSNHFSSLGTSFTASIAKIPWLFSWFRGFIIGLLHENKLYRFATYTGAELKNLKIADEFVEYVVSDKKYELKVKALRKESGILFAPYGNKMVQRVKESLSSQVFVELIDIKNNRVIFSDTGFCAGLDVNGKIEEIVD